VNACVYAPIYSTKMGTLENWYDSPSPGRQTSDPEMNLGLLMISSDAFTA
jgi:hypothetical protein